MNYFPKNNNVETNRAKKIHQNKKWPKTTWEEKSQKAAPNNY